MINFDNDTANLLFYILFALPVLPIALLIVGSFFDTKQVKRKLRLASGVIGLLSLPLYIAYEANIGPQWNIRLDLVVIWPSVLFCLGVGGYSLRSARKFKE